MLDVSKVSEPYSYKWGEKRGNGLPFTGYLLKARHFTYDFMLSSQ